MTPDQINIAIMKELGWSQVNLRRGTGGCMETWERTNSCGGTDALGSEKNFTYSLDVCSEFEGALWFTDRFDYYASLRKAVSGKEPSADYESGEMVSIALASARQRCEAFLRMKGKWVE